MENKLNTPDYKQIFIDIIEQKFPDKNDEYVSILNKEKFSVMEIIEINKMIFGTNEQNLTFNQKQRSYSKSDILKILDFQKKNRLNNTKLAMHFKLSRNTVAKWKKTFLV
ncbi:helix-turn-helix domain-containing protein [Chryseobacterium lathyri]|uniref:helix-turn-helix domain-containing protein n=1 Tax=Chryseobacterium lathyri TaxID=395933 RepID=UPI001CBCC617|nr:helix-turn-helix domain-containing protein [Chryseobacterium lathyri]